MLGRISSLALGFGFILFSQNIPAAEPSQCWRKDAQDEKFQKLPDKICISSITATLIPFEPRLKITIAGDPYQGDLWFNKDKGLEDGSYLASSVVYSDYHGGHCDESEEWAIRLQVHVTTAGKVDRVQELTADYTYNRDSCHGYPQQMKMSYRGLAHRY